MKSRYFLLTWIGVTACGGRPPEKFEPIGEAKIFSQVVGAGVLSAELNSFLDPLAHAQWYFKNSGQPSPKGMQGVPGADIRVGALATLPRLPSTEDVVIAVIDTGLAQNHSDLDSTRLALNPGENGLDADGRSRASNGVDDDKNGFIDDHTGWSFADNNPNTSDTLGHGTHVAGLLMARTNNGNGIATPWHGIKILPLQIFSSRHPAPTAETIALAIRYAVERGARVISASFGTPSSSESMKAAIEMARERDVLFVSAVGNFRKNQDIEPSFPAGFNLDNQISVGATERRDLAAGFSSFGTLVDLFAPGEEILSLGLNNDFLIRSGTSQATPLVAAAAATARQLLPQATAQEIKQLLLDAADELPGLSGFSRTARRLNVENIIHKRTGLRQRKFDFETWKSKSVTLESEHPYRANLRQEYTIDPPEGSRFMRLEFSHFATQSSDTLEIIDADNKVISLLSGALGSLWTTVVPAQTLTLRFSSDQYVSDFGWKIGRIQYID
ncbi:MAG: hypothetical protein FJY29_13135 [Betaproteobacteria bacterium]|nr:hypothetical protein [Betaproteobacteria bacterium]